MSAKHTSSSSGPDFDKLFRGIDPNFIGKVEPFLEGLWKHYFRCEIEGWENVPEERRALFVGNHNGLLTFEVLMLFFAWHKRFGTTRKALGLAHGIVLHNPFFKWLLRMGAIPADPEIADAALDRGFSLLVYPGGEKESFRPYSERGEVNFYGRKGFLKLALRNKIPIVPIVSIGAHESYIILDRGEEIAEALGLKKRFRLHGLPITFRSVFFLWCVFTGIFTFFPLLIAPWALAATFIPLPAKMKFRILDPIDLMKHYDSAKSEDENLDHLYNVVVEAMQKVLTEEYAKRRLPIIG